MSARAFVSYDTIFHDHQFRGDDLKLCYLWNDEILFETINNQEPLSERIRKHEELSKKDLFALTDILIPLNEKVGEATIYPNGPFNQQDHSYPRWGKNHEYYHYPEPKNPRQYAHNQLLKKIEAEYDIQHIDRSFCEPLEGKARSATLSVELWERVNVEYPCIMQSNTDEALAIQSFKEFRYPSAGVVDPFQLFQLIVPSFSNVSWHDVIELRKKGSFDALRSKISEAVDMSSNSLHQAKELIEQFESDVINEIINKHRPKIKKIALESVLANIPGIPIANPAGIYFNIRDIRNQVKDFHNYNWFYLLRDIRHMKEQKNIQ